MCLCCVLQVCLCQVTSPWRGDQWHQQPRHLQGTCQKCILHEETAYETEPCHCTGENTVDTGENTVDTGENTIDTGENTVVTGENTVDSRHR